MTEMELPNICPNGHPVMIDWDKLEGRPLSKIYKVFGFSCPVCSAWKPCWFSSAQLDENLKRLSEMNPRNPSFWYHFVKTRNRSIEIQARGRKEYGEIGFQDMAIIG
jgi:hypothetical protein